jgi:hypothetical protein
MDTIAIYNSLVVFHRYFTFLPVLFLTKGHAAAIIAQLIYQRATMKKCNKRDAYFNERRLALKRAALAAGITFESLAREMDCAPMAISYLFKEEDGKGSLDLLERAEIVLGRLCRERVIELGRTLADAASTSSGFHASFSYCPPNTTAGF